MNRRAREDRREMKMYIFWTSVSEGIGLSYQKTHMKAEERFSAQIPSTTNVQIPH